MLTDDEQRHADARLRAKLGDDLHRIARACSGNFNESTFAYYAGSIAGIADIAEAAVTRGEPLRIERARIFVTPPGILDGLLERLVEMVTNPAPAYVVTLKDIESRWGDAVERDDRETPRWSHTEGRFRLYQYDDGSVWAVFEDKMLMVVKPDLDARARLDLRESGSIELTRDAPVRSTFRDNGDYNTDLRPVPEAE
jgi:hypothetical protein